MKNSQPNICENCHKKWYRLVDGQVINHNCEPNCEHKNTVELEDDNGNKARGCRDCKEII